MIEKLNQSCKMKKIYCFLFLFIEVITLQVALSNKIESSSTPTDASVAVLDCSQKHPNVYFDVLRKEWLVHSGDGKCYNNDEDLLELCRAVYPGLAVRNVMRLDQPVKFTVYACSETEKFQAKVLSLGSKSGCKKVLKKSVKPYRCLYGEYKPADLVIPAKCEFMHLYSNENCQTQDHWNLLATEKCKSSQLSLNSSMLLKWCDGVAIFKGIEFVCCPKPAYDFISQPQLVIEDENIDDDYVYDSPYDYNYQDYIPTDLNNNNYNNKQLIERKENFNQVVPSKLSEVKKLDEMKSSMDKLDANEFIENFNRVKAVVDSLDVRQEEESDLAAVEGTREQKQQYEKQKNFIIMTIQNSTEKLINEKKSTSDYLRKTSDEKNSIFYEPMLRNLDDQYQVRFDKLNKEKDRLLLQEEISYEQQVQGRLNEKKLNAVKSLNSVMQEEKSKTISNTNLDRLVKAVNSFFIAQENDRLHMITVYKKLKAYFPEQVYERSQSIVNHLESIDKTLNETTTVFISNFQLLSKCVLPLLKEHLKRYDQVRYESQSIRNELKNLKSNYIVTELRSTEAPPLIKLGKSMPNVLNPVNSKNTIMEYYADDMSGKMDDSDQFEDDDYMKYEDSYDEEDYESLETKSSQENTDGNNINIRRLNGNESNISTLILMTLVCLGIIVSLLLTYALIKRQRSRENLIVKHGFLPVDTANPEDRHVNAMQTNGYENPTYKYFEATAQA